MKSKVKLAFLAAALSFSVAGCGSERGYEVPNSLCEVPVPAEYLEPLLTSGEELEQQESGFGANRGLEGCEVLVDEKVAISTRGEWHRAGETAADAAGNPAPKPFGDGQYTVWDRGASAAIPCRATGEEVVASDGGGQGAEVFTLEVHVPTPDEHTEAAMKKLIVPYAKAYREKLTCEGR